MTSDELEKRVDYTASTVRRNLKILEDMGWLKKENRIYSVQQEKAFLITPLLRADRVLRVFQEHRDHWETHDLSPIPDALRDDFGMLQGGEVVTGTMARPRLPLEREAELAQGAKKLKKLSPAYVPEYGEMAKEWAEDGASLEVVATVDAVTAFRSDNPGVAEEFSETGELEVRCVDALLVGLLVGDDFVILNLPRRDGTFDLNRVFVARTPEAVEWGERLFAHYWERARPFGEEKDVKAEA